MRNGENILSASAINFLPRLATSYDIWRMFIRTCENTNPFYANLGSQRSEAWQSLLVWSKRNTLSSIVASVNKYSLQTTPRTINGKLLKWYKEAVHVNFSHFTYVKNIKHHNIGDLTKTKTTSKLLILRAFTSYQVYTPPSCRYFL